MIIVEYETRPRRRWVWPWEAVRLINQEIKTANELRMRTESQARRIVELDGLCQRAAERVDQARPDAQPKAEEEEQAPMTAEEQERVDGLRSNNKALRIKLAAAEAIAKERDEIAFSRDEFRTLYMAAAERLTQAHQVLEAAGLLDKLPPVKAPEEREQENDSATRQAERGFTR